MGHYKRKRAKNRRAGCLLCKPWKVNGFGKRYRADGEKFSDHKRRRFALEDTAEVLTQCRAEPRSSG